MREFLAERGFLESEEMLFFMAKKACHSERSGVSAANATQSRKRSKPVHLLQKQTGNPAIDPSALLQELL